MSRLERSHPAARSEVNATAESAAHNVLREVNKVSAGVAHIFGAPGSHKSAGSIHNTGDHHKAVLPNLTIEAHRIEGLADASVSGDKSATQKLCKETYNILNSQNAPTEVAKLNKLIAADGYASKDLHKTSISLYDSPNGAPGVPLEVKKNGTLTQQFNLSGNRVVEDTIYPPNSDAALQ